MKIELLRWLWGWASLVDGLVAIFTLGLYRPSLSIRVSAKILRDWLLDKQISDAVNEESE